MTKALSLPRIRAAFKIPKPPKPWYLLTAMLFGFVGFWCFTSFFYKVSNDKFYPDNFFLGVCNLLWAKDHWHMAWDKNKLTVPEAMTAIACWMLGVVFWLTPGI